LSRSGSEGENESEEDSYVPYVPLKERKRQKLEQLSRLSRPNGRDKKEASSVGNDVVKDGDLEVPVGRKANVSLLDQHSELKKQAEGVDL
jgi:ATP-dependent RNA helicase DDX41